MQPKLCFTESGLCSQDGNKTKMMRIGREEGFLGFVLLITTCFKSCFLSLMMSAEKLFPRVTLSTDTLELHNSFSLFHHLFTSATPVQRSFQTHLFSTDFQKQFHSTTQQTSLLFNWNYYERIKFVTYFCNLPESMLQGIQRL